MKDVCDGTALLAVVHFYCPELMRLEGRKECQRVVSTHEHNVKKTSSAFVTFNIQPEGVEQATVLSTQSKHDILAPTVILVK